jgi:hypothetical protein
MTAAAAPAHRWQTTARHSAAKWVWAGGLDDQMALPRCVSASGIQNDHSGVPWTATPLAAMNAH